MASNGAAKPVDFCQEAEKARGGSVSIGLPRQFSYFFWSFSLVKNSSLYLFQSSEHFISLLQPLGRQNREIWESRYTLQYTLPAVHFTVHYTTPAVLLTVYTLKITPPANQCTVYTLYYTPSAVHRTVYSILNTVHTPHITVYRLKLQYNPASVHCEV